MQCDEEIIKEILKGDKYATESLVNKYYKLIFAYTYRSVGDYHIAYDLTQEVFIKMLKNLKKYKNKENKFNNWLLKIAVNTCKDYLKSSYYNHNQCSEDVVQLKDKKQDEYDNNVVNIFERKEERTIIKGALDKLSNEQREVIILKFYNSLKAREISNILGINENTVKSRIRNGLINLKKHLTGGEKKSEEKRI